MSKASLQFSPGPPPPPFEFGPSQFDPRNPSDGNDAGAALKSVGGRTASRVVWRGIRTLRRRAVLLACARNVSVLLNDATFMCFGCFLHARRTLKHVTYRVAMFDSCHQHLTSIASPYNLLSGRGVSRIVKKRFGASSLICSGYPSLHHFGTILDSPAGATQDEGHTGVVLPHFLL